MNYDRRRFVRTLFAASLAGRYLKGTASAAQTPVTPPEPGGVNFMVFGDWGRRGEPDQTAVANQMAKSAEEIGAQFVVSVGDNFYETGVVSAEDPQWAESFENVYKAASLQVPWHVILGNHDYLGDCDSQIEYGKTHPRWNMPARYFTQSLQVDDATALDFFFIDTTPLVKSYLGKEKYRSRVITQDTEKQLAWFADKLAASTAPWKIVFGHHPIYSGGGHGDEPDLIKNVLPPLEKYKVQAYFNGHDHDLQCLKKGDLNLFDSGGGAQARENTLHTPYTRFAKGVPGFMTVAIRPGDMTVQIIDSSGTPLFETTLPRVPA